VLVPGQEIDFGTTPFDTEVTRSFTIENIGDFTLSVSAVSLIGEPQGIFTLSGQSTNFTVAAGSSSTFTVAFDHDTAETVERIVRIASNDLDQPAIEFSVIATALAPPLLTDVSVSSVTALGVTFAGTVDPQDSATEVLFEYSEYADFAGALEVLTTSGSTQGFANGCGPAAKFDTPFDVVVDRFGNIYVADTGNHRIRRIAPNGDCVVLAGTGEVGLANGPGNEATFSSPKGIAVDAAGNVFVADTNNHRIRKINPAGVVSTVAGSGTIGAYTDGIVSGARFNQPIGIAVDASGNLYVADFGNQSLRKISTSGEVSTLKGSLTIQAVAVARDGQIVIAGGEGSGNQITELSPLGVILATHSTGFSNPTGVAVDASDRIYVADSGNNRIVRIDPGDPTSVVVDIAGVSGDPGANDGSGTNDSGIKARFNMLTGIAVSPSGTVYVTDISSDASTHRIRQVNLAARRVVAATNLLAAPTDPVTLNLVGLEPSTTYYYRGIARNDGGEVATLPLSPIPGLTFTTLDNNAELVELSVNGLLVPGFNPCVYSYPLAVESPASSMMLRVRSGSPDAEIQLFKNGSLVGDLESEVSSSPLPLVVGANPFQVTVTSADGTSTKTYSVTATLTQSDSQFAQWQTLKFGSDASNAAIAAMGRYASNGANETSASRTTSA
jgi:sugar lactone lactonase YvrE